MQAIILAGGLGSRLKSVVSDVPKPMADISGRPFLDYLLHYLVQQGVTTVVLSLHHQHDVIQNHYAGGFAGLSLHFVVENQLLGTGGAIRYAMQVLDRSVPFFVVNGDTFVEVDYQKMYEQHLAAKGLLTMSLRQLHDCSRYGYAVINDEHVTAFLEKNNSTSGFINAGVYLLSGNCFNAVDLPAIFSLENDYLYPHVSDIKPRYVLTEGYFIDIGVPDDYRRAQNELPERVRIA